MILFYHLKMEIAPKFNIMITILLNMYIGIIWISDFLVANANIKKQIRIYGVFCLLLSSFILNLHVT